MYQISLILKQRVFLALMIILVIFSIGLRQFINSSSANSSGKNQPPKSQVCQDCNILIMDLDILRADALPCYGYFRNTAPNICQLAQKSIQFNNNFSADHWTLPSAFSTITSLYPSFHGIGIGYLDKISLEIPTLAETLKKAGYQTALVGDLNNFAFLTDQNGGTKGYDLITEKPLAEIITQLSKETKPWFIHYYKADLHMPYFIPENIQPIADLPAPQNFPVTEKGYNLLLNKYLKKNYQNIFQKKAILEFNSTIVGPDIPGDTKLTELFNSFSENGKLPIAYLKDVWKPKFFLYMESFNQKDPADVAYVRMLYDSCIKINDAEFGKIFQQLNDQNLSQKTLTVVMSDHGEAFGEHGTFTHDRNFHTELFHTPLIIYSPKLTNQKIDFPTSNMDIFPTLMALIGLKSPPTLQGKSLLPEINGLTNDPEKFILSEVSYLGIILQNKTWLYYLPNEAFDIKDSILYNKVSDPTEQVNVMSEYPDLTSRLYKQIRLFRSYRNLLFDQPKFENQNQINLSPAKIENMKKDGYF